MPERILGISAFYHDSACALLEDGILEFAIQEERLSRLKFDASFPKMSIVKTLEFARLRIEEIDAFVFYEKPFLKFDRIFETFLAVWPFGFKMFSNALNLWLREKLFQRRMIINELSKLGLPKKLAKDRIYFSEHHLSHASSAFYPSPFKEALILTLDGVGEWATTSVSIADQNRITRLKQMDFPHSLGLLYSAFTQYCGFKVNSGEYKLMGLAPYGKPKFRDKIFENLIEVNDDGSFKLNLEYFEYLRSPQMVGDKFCKLFGRPIRNAETDIDLFYADIAASIQQVLEEVVLKMCHSLLKEYKQSNLVLAGGVALNCVANSKILNNIEGINLWIQPAAGDSGGAIGAAYAYHFSKSENQFSGRNLENNDDLMNGAYLGDSFTKDEILKTLNEFNLRFSVLNEQTLYPFIAKKIALGNAVGWFQGRMEFGPRALGNRSILADPRNPNTQRDLNLKTKFRESFRPFAPSITTEDSSIYFDLRVNSPYMLFTAQLNESQRISIDDESNSHFSIKAIQEIPRSLIPAVTHVDYSARIQTVSKQTNPRFHKLITSFKSETGIPILVNTSFNVRGEPIVHSPLDAIRCFFTTNIDTLVLDYFVVEKIEQDLNNPKLLALNSSVADD